MIFAALLLPLLLLLLPSLPIFFLPSPSIGPTFVFADGREEQKAQLLHWQRLQCDFACTAEQNPPHSSTLLSPGSVDKLPISWNSGFPIAREPKPATHRLEYRIACHPVA